MLLFSCKGGTYAKGGKLNKQTGVDLLLNEGKHIPEDVLVIFYQYNDAISDKDTRKLRKMKQELRKIGYTIEIKSNGEIFDLRAIGQKGKISGYANGGLMKNLDKI
jgi:hypothetical protein